MTAKVSPDTLAAAVVDSVLHNAFPDSDELAQAELSPALPTIQLAIQASRAEITNTVIETSRTNAEEIDSWIHHGQKLREDIQTNKERARRILEENKIAKALDEKRKDAEAHVRFLRDEVAFTENLSDMLVRIRDITALLAKVADEVSRGDLDVAVDSLFEAEGSLKALQEWEDIFVVHLLRTKAVETGKTVVDAVERSWRDLIRIEAERGSISVTDLSEGKVAGGKIAESLRKLGTFENKIDELHVQLESALFAKLLESSSGGIREVKVEHGTDGRSTISFTGSLKQSNPENLFGHLKEVISLLAASLAPSIWRPLSQILIPALVAKLISQHLPDFIPSALAEIQGLDAVLQDVTEFDRFMTNSGWTEGSELSDWVRKAGRTWLTKRRIDALDAVRTGIAHHVQERQMVTRKVAEPEEPMEGEVEDFADAWEANWGDDDDNNESVKSPASGNSKSESLLKIDANEDETDGWGLDVDLEDDTNTEPFAGSAQANEQEKDEEEEADWSAWGEDLEVPDVDSPVEPKSATKTRKLPAKEAKKPLQGVAEEEEKYTVTAVPKLIYDLILQVTTDAAELKSNPEYAKTPIANSSAGLLTIPAQVLAIYRALAPVHYVGSLSAPMLLYNDLAHLLSLLSDLTEQQSISVALPSIQALLKRSYQTAVSTERTILLDILESAQGFVQSTEGHQRNACFEAISGAIARAKEVEKEWSNILSATEFKRAFTLTILESIAEKIVNDIEDIEDIAEDESRILSSLLQTVVFSFEHLPRGKQMKKLAALAKILEASMAEIMEMMGRGEMDGYEGDEVKELIRALFAESDLRRHVMIEVDRWAAAKG